MLTLPDSKFGDCRLDTGVVMVCKDLMFTDEEVIGRRDLSTTTALALLLEASEVTQKYLTNVATLDMRVLMVKSLPS